MFPDAEGWEYVEPEEAAKWSMASEFPPEQSQTQAGASAEMPTGIVENQTF